MKKATIPFFLLMLPILTSAQNIVRVDAPIDPPPKDPLPVVSNLSFNTKLIHDPSQATAESYSFKASFSASGYSKLILVSSTGQRYDVTGLSEYVLNSNVPLKNVNYQIEAEGRSGITKSPQVSINDLRWCKYSYNNRMWHSTPTGVTLHDKNRSLTITRPTISHTHNGWYYGYHDGEMKYGADEYYNVCMSGSPIPQNPNPRQLAQCVPYVYANNRWVDLGSRQDIKWNGAGEVFSIVVNQTAKTYDRNGWRYYINPSDTVIDQYWPICRHLIPN